MAEGKKSFIVYSDWKDLFESLNDKRCALLIRHIFKYVNDENPKLTDPAPKAVWSIIKSTLKRDLEKWHNQLEQRKQAGLKSAESRKRKPTSVNEKEQVSTDNDNVSVNDSVNVNDNSYKKTLLSEIKISDHPKLNPDYLNIALSFKELFRKNLTEAGATLVNINKANGTWIDDVRLMIESDGYNKEDLRGAFQFLQTGVFWKQNILSVSKLRTDG